MQRTELSHGTVLLLNNQRYIIDTVIGDGATCIVYSAHYQDAVGYSHRVNIKECYPYKAEVKRTEIGLCWASENERDNSLALLRRAYEKLMDWQNESFAVNVFDICEANNTLYIIMNADKGRTFDQETSKSLCDILTTIKLLTYFVGKYHANGYLHLDLKPSNFLIYPRPSEHIVLFDMDTVTAMDDIMSGRAKYVSYSDEWAAPEQKQGKISKLCPATDLFSIGAILFEKVMGRPVCAADMGMFADWEFEGELFENVNPKIKRLLRSIFHKTLAANTSRRYQSANLMIADLDDAIETARAGQPFLISQDLHLVPHFAGRKKEILNIRQAFSNKKKAVFLHGIGGIGKSSLALAYAVRNKRDYDNVLFCRYRDSLEGMLDDIDVFNCEATDEQKRKTLKRLLDQHTLVIVDNFDTTVDKEPFLYELLQFRCHFIFTTRTDFKYLPNNSVQIEVLALDYEQLEVLFCKVSGMETVSAEDREKLRRLLKSVDYHTYVTELLGRQMAASGWSLNRLISKLKTGMDDLYASPKIRIVKDQRVYKDVIPEIIRMLFHIANLDEDSQQTLRNMYMLRFLNIDYDTYYEFTYRFKREYKHDVDSLNDLAELGWLQKNGTYFTVHPLVEELIKNDLNPNEENCHGVYDKVKGYIRDCCDEWTEYDQDDVEQEKYKRISNFLCMFFCNVSLESERNRQLLFKWLIGVAEHESAEVGSPFDTGFSKLYQSLISLISDGKTTADEAVKIRYIILAAWLRQAPVIYYGEYDYKNQLCQEMLLESFSLAVEAADELPSDEKENALDRIYKLIFDRVQRYHFCLIPNDFLQQLYAERPHACSFSAYKKYSFGFPLSLSEELEVKEIEKSINEMFFENDSSSVSKNTDTDEETQCIDAFNSSENKVSFIEQIINDRSIPAFKRAKLVGCCREKIFQPLQRWGYVASETDMLDWSVMEQILSVEESFLISDEIQCENSSEREELYSQLSDNAVNQIIVFVVLEKIGNYKNALENLMDNVGREIEWYLSIDSLWSRYVDLCNYGSMPLLSVLNGLKNIKKTSWFLPCLIRYADGWEKYIEENNFDANPIFPIYEEIVECADLALLEQDIPACFQLDYSAISKKYRERMDAITGISYSVRQREE